MEEWEDERYKHLLKSGVLLRNKDWLSNNIKLSEYYGIEKYITINYLKKSLSQNYALISYLNSNNIKVIDNGKLNGIFSCQPGQMLKKYGIDLKNLIEMYPIEERVTKHAVR